MKFDVKINAIGDKIQIKKFMNRLGQCKDFVGTARELKWNWLGLIARQNLNRRTEKTISRYNKTGRKKRKQKKRWDDEILSFLNNRLYHRLAWGRQTWAWLKEAFP